MKQIVGLSYKDVLTCLSGGGVDGLVPLVRLRGGDPVAGHGHGQTTIVEVSHLEQEKLIKRMLNGLF